MSSMKRLSSRLGWSIAGSASPSRGATIPSTPRMIPRTTVGGKYQPAPGRPVRVPSSEESGAPGAEPGAVVSLGRGVRHNHQNQEGDGRRGVVWWNPFGLTE